MKEWKRVTCCPYCGWELEISDHYVLTKDYRITKSGVLSKRFKLSDPGPMDCTTGYCCGCERAFDSDNITVENRVKIHPKPEKNTCGSCGHFHRIPGLCCGTCETKSRYKNKHGQEDERRGTFTPPQSRKACKNYIPMEGEQYENQT